MRSHFIAPAIVLAFAAPLSAWAEQPVTAATPAPAAATAPAAPPAAAAAPLAAASTAPIDKVVVSPQKQEAAESQIDLEALNKDEEKPKFELEGYYRVRANYFNQFELGAKTKGTTEQFFEHRLRLEPKFNLNPSVTFEAEIEAMDDQVWGANPGNVLTQSTADKVPNVTVKRAWADVMLPVGRLSAGRMPSHWGMGLFSNDGRGFRNDFGDAHYGTTLDRVMFGTKPLGMDSNWIAAIVYDKIAAVQPIGSVSPENKSGVDEVVGILLFDTEPLKLGAYQLYRYQKGEMHQCWDLAHGGMVPCQNPTKLNSTDVYFKLDLGLLYAETEQVFIYSSQTGSVPVLNQSNFQVSYPKVLISQYGYAAKVGIKQEMYGLEYEWGNATGDVNGQNDVDSKTGKPAPKVTDFKFHPDYHVGMIMFEYANRLNADRLLEEQLAGLDTLNEQGVASDDTVSKMKAASDLARTNGSVTNAHYQNPKIKIYCLDGKIDTVLGYLHATANAPRTIRQQTGVKKFDSYGHELDVAVNFHYTKNFVFGVQYGVLFPGEYFDRQDIITGDITKPTKAQALQGRFTILF